jgi:TrpR-related protein YerC/YecD
MSVGLNAMFEDRLGGDIEYIKGNGNDTHSYFEKNKTQRHSTQLTFEHKFGEKDRIDFKNSVTYFNRNIGVPTYTFEGTQVSTFSELTYTRKNLKTEAVDHLFDAILCLKDRAECYTFFEDVCTVNELFSLSQRFEVAKMLREQKTYLDIAEKTGASTATISRVNRSLNYGNDGYDMVFSRMEDGSDKED